MKFFAKKISVVTPLPAFCQWWRRRQQWPSQENQATAGNAVSYNLDIKSFMGF